MCKHFFYFFSYNNDICYAPRLYFNTTEIIIRSALEKNTKQWKICPENLEIILFRRHGAHRFLKNIAK